MFKKAILSIIVVAGVATASMTSNIQQAFAQEGQQAPPKEFTGEIPTMFTRQPLISNQKNSPAKASQNAYPMPSVIQNTVFGSEPKVVQVREMTKIGRACQ